MSLETQLSNGINSGPYEFQLGGVLFTIQCSSPESLNYIKRVCSGIGRGEVEDIDRQVNIRVVVGKFDPDTIIGSRRQTVHRDLNVEYGCLSDGRFFFSSNCGYLNISSQEGYS